MRAFEIPLAPRSQRFSVALAGKTYRMLTVWNTVMLAWILDIADETDVLLIGGIPLVAGADLLAQYGYLNFGGMLVCFTNGDVNAAPTFENLGITSHLYFVVQ